MKRNPFHSGAAFLRRIAWLNIIVQLMFPLLSAFTPATAHVNINQTDINKTEKKTIFTETYTLKKGETASSVAKKYNLTLDELRQLNQQRSFPHTFSHIQAGEDIDVPHRKSPFSVDNTNNKNTDANTEKNLASKVYAGATVLSNENVAKSGERMLRSTATNQINHSVEQWLSQFGTARVKINSNNKLDGSAADILIPLYDQKDAMLFTQLGARNKDSRNTVNVGMGFRTFNNNWMYGANSFLDNDITGKNRRISLGAEAWTDYLKLSANSYFGITDWHQSRDFNGYNERPADGYDIRAEAYLPSYPQIGGKLMYEKYRGENVALFGKDNQQKNPYATTIGVNYTPFPLLTVGTEHRAGKGGHEDNNISLQLNYSFGNSWQYHISPSALTAHRSVSGNRYNLVERNNHIVLDYQKKDEIQLTLPESIQGNTGDTATVTARVTGKHALERIEWNAAPLVAAGGKLTPTSINTVAITLPPYQHPGQNNTNHYQLTAFAYDVEGNQSNQAVTAIKVADQGISAAHSTTTATPNILLADGQATSLIAITLRDNNNNPISGVASQLVLSSSFTANTTAQRNKIEANNKDIHIGTITESSAGVYHSTLTAGTQVGIVAITPSINEQKLQAVDISLITNVNAATVFSLTPDVTTAPADDKTPVVFTAVVKDSGGNVVSNADVRFTTTDGTLSQPTTVSTNANGEATVSLTSANVGNITVTAKVNNNTADTGKNATVAFTTNITTTATVFSLTPDVTTAPADDKTPVVFTAVVKDSDGSVVSNADVRFTTNGGTLNQETATTNANGEATVSLTSANVGNITVTANVKNNPADEGQSATVIFIISSVVSLTSDVTTAIADGLSPILFTATVKDNLGNLTPNVIVTFVNESGTSLSQNTATTNANGQATVSLTSSTVGSFPLTAKVDNNPADNGMRATVSFIADIATAAVADIKSESRTAVAGVDTVMVTATVKDKFGNLVQNADVTFTTSLGSISPPTATTDANGQASVALESSPVGNATVTAKVSSNANDSGRRTTVTFTTTTTTATVLSLTPNTTTAQVVDKTPVVFTAVVKDSGGNVVSNADVRFTTTDGTLSQPTAITDANGEATVSLTSANVGNITVTANVENNPADQGQNATVSFIISSVVNLTPNTTTGIANNEFAILFTATVKDNLGNLTPNVIVTFVNESGTSLSQTTATTNANGQATVSLISSTVGSFSLTAQVENNPADNGIRTTVSFIANIATAIVANIKPESRTAVADVDTVMVTTTVKDKFGHLVQNADVAFTTSLGSISPQIATTDANGKASAVLRSPVGDAIVTAKVSSNASDRGNTTMVTFVEDIDRSIPKPE